jgi:hypothetical protein
VQDSKGNKVFVGSKVRVLDVPNLEHSLEPEEWLQIQSMRGEILEIYEIDKYGGAWVEKWWDDGNGQSTSHSLSLASSDIEYVSG